MYVLYVKLSIISSMSMELCSYFLTTVDPEPTIQKLVSKLLMSGRKNIGRQSHI